MTYWDRSNIGVTCCNFNNHFLTLIFRIRIILHHERMGLQVIVKGVLRFLNDLFFAIIYEKGHAAVVIVICIVDVRLVPAIAVMTVVIEFIFINLFYLRSNDYIDHHSCVGSLRWLILR